MPIKSIEQVLEEERTGVSEPVNLTSIPMPGDKSTLTGYTSEVEEESSFGDVLGAAWNRDSEWKGIFDYATGDRPDGFYQTPAETRDRAQNALRYNAYDKMPEEMRDFAGSATWVTTDDEYSQWEAKTRDEMSQLKVLGESGWKTLGAELLIGVIDPSVLLPGGAIYKAGKAAAIGVNAARGAAMSAGIATADEVLLHQNQNTRTMDESLMTVGGSVLLGGVASGAAGAFHRMKVKTAEGNLIDLSVDDVQREMNNLYNPQSLSAAHVSPEFADADYQVKGMEGSVAKNVTGWAPVLQASKQGVPELITTLESITGDALTRGGSAKGLTNQLGMDELMQTYKGQIMELQVKGDDLFSQYQKRSGDSVLTRQIKKRKDSSGGEGTLTQKEFFKEVGKTRVSGKASDIPEVNDMAKMYDDLLYTPMTNEAVRLGLLTAEKASDPKYMNRIWNKRAILDDMDNFKKRVAVPQARKWITDNIADLTARLDAGDIESPTHIQNLTDQIDNYRRWMDDDTILDEISQDIIDVMVGRKIGDNAFDNMLQMPNQMGLGKHNFLKERVIDIDNEDVMDFIETDISIAGGAYFNQMNRKIGLKAWADRHDASSVGEVFKRVTDVYDQKIALAKDKKAKDALRKQRDKSKTLLENVLKRELGIYNQSSQTTKEVAGLVKALGVMVHLPNTLIVSMGDVGRIISESSVTSLLRTMKDHPPLIPRALMKDKQLVSDVARQYLGLAENLNNRRLLQLAGMAEDDLDEISWTVRQTHNVGNLFGKMSGMGKWNQYWKEVAVMTVEHDLVAAMRRAVAGQARSGGFIHKNDIAELSRFGIDMNDVPAMLKEIDTAVGSAGDKFGYSGFNKWQNEQLRRKFSASLVRVSNSVIVTPTGANLPLFMSSTAGSLVMQFKSFAFAAHTQATVALKSNPTDINRWMGFGFSALLGMNIMDLKGYVESGFVEYPDTPTKQKVLSGIDYTGAFSLLFLLNSEVQKQTGMRQGLTPWLLDEVKPWPAYGSNSLLGILGPVAGDAGLLFDSAQTKMRGGDINEKTERRMLGLIPGWRWFGARYVTKQMEDSFVD